MIMLFRGEMSERISAARTVTEGKDLLALPERSPRMFGLIEQNRGFAFYICVSNIGVSQAFLEILRLR